MNASKDENAKRIIVSLFHKLGIVEWRGLITSILQKVDSISPTLSSSLKFSKHEKLIPLVVYLELKIHNISFCKASLIKYSSLTEKELSSFIRQLMRYSKKEW